MDKIKVPLILSVIMGIMFGVPMYLLIRWIDPELSYLGVIAGVLFALLLLEYMLIHQKHMEKRYAEAEKLITSPIIYRLNGNMKTERGVRNANIYLCEGGFAFISLDKKPHITEELLLSNIAAVSVVSSTQLEIATKDERFYSITSADVSRLISVLREKGWITPY